MPDLIEGIGLILHFVDVEVSEMVDCLLVRRAFPQFGQIDHIVSCSLPLVVGFVTAVFGGLVDDVGDSYAERTDAHVVCHLLAPYYHKAVLLRG